MNMLLQHVAQNPAQFHMAQFAAGAHGAARSAWIEINRPLTSLGVVPTYGISTLPTVAVTAGPIGLPIGMDIKSITCIASDVDTGWMLVNFTLGSLNLVNGSGSQMVNLSMFDPRLQHNDRLAPWILSKTRVDVQVSVSLLNYGIGHDVTTGSVASPQGNVFHGFSLNAFQEEQVCAIQTRIEPTDRNVGVADLIGIQRTVLGSGLGLNMPRYNQPPSQIGASHMAIQPMSQYHPQQVVGQAPIHPTMFQARR